MVVYHGTDENFYVFEKKGFLRRGDEEYQNFANAEEAFRKAYEEAVTAYNR